MAAKCEYLFCVETATARLTVPRLKPRLCACEAHLAELVAWAQPYRNVPGRVIVEQLASAED